MVLNIVTEVEESRTLEISAGEMAKDVLAFKRDMMNLAPGIGESVLMDFTGIERMSPAAYGVLAYTSRRLKAQGCELRAIRLTGNLRQTFSYLGLDRLLNVEGECEQMTEGN